MTSHCDGGWPEMSLGARSPFPFSTSLVPRYGCSLPPPRGIVDLMNITEIPQAPSCVPQGRPSQGPVCETTTPAVGRVRCAWRPSGTGPVHPAKAKRGAALLLPTTMRCILAQASFRGDNSHESISRERRSLLLTAAFGCATRISRVDLSAGLVVPQCRYIQLEPCWRILGSSC